MLDEGVLNGRFAWAIVFALLTPSIAARSQDPARVAPLNLPRTTESSAT